MEERWEKKVVKELLSKERFDKESWEMEAWMSMWDLRREIRRFEGKYDYCYCPIVKMNEDRKLYRRMHMMLRNPNQVGERLRAEKAAVRNGISIHSYKGSQRKRPEPHTLQLRIL